VSGCRSILVAFDGAPHSQRALEVAIELAVGAHARLTVLTAAREIPCTAYTGAAGNSVAYLRRVVVADAERTLCEAIKQVPQNVSVTKICSHEPIRAAILRQLGRAPHDLVVVGAPARGRIRARLPRSVGRFLLRRSPVPVLIVHPPATSAGEAEAPRPAPALTGVSPHTA
jgi:nucleotide-binding universal stress UspA family protein